MIGAKDSRQTLGIICTRRWRWYTFRFSSNLCNFDNLNLPHVRPLNCAIAVFPKQLTTEVPFSELKWRMRMVALLILSTSEFYTEISHHTSQPFNSLFTPMGVPADKRVTSSKAVKAYAAKKILKTILVLLQQTKIATSVKLATVPWRPLFIFLPISETRGLHNSQLVIRACMGAVIYAKEILG